MKNAICQVRGAVCMLVMALGVKTARGTTLTKMAIHLLKSLDNKFTCAAEVGLMLSVN